MRKNAALLKSTKLKPDAAGKASLEWLAKQTPAEGCEEAWEKYIAACHEEVESYARYDVVYKQVEKEGGSSTCKSWDAFQSAGHVWGVKAQAAYSYLDAYLRAVKAVGEDVVAAEEELREVIGASLSDNLGALVISLKSSGLLGAKIAQAIRGDVIEHEYTDLPLCDDDA